MITSGMLEAFRDYPRMRAEFLSAIRLGRRGGGAGNLFG